ncbi:MAG: C4-dicarboxylate transport transcriptional regulatory protein [Labilithrix sp.]|nr:C4-dicarboxylate transport transcriptional regulatory protein [Labilithrix sp.]
MTGSPRALLVEDDADARLVLARALRREGLDCTEASDVASASAALGASAFDVVVLDIVLGDDESGGLRVLAQLRETGSSAPVVLISAFADVEKLKRALNLGASYLLDKPFRSKELVATVQKLLADQRDLGGLVTSAVGRAGLTEREAEVARLVLKGLPSLEIATLLGASEKTVRQHLSRIYDKCGVTSRAEFFNFVFPF